MSDEQRMREQFEKWEQTEAAAFLDDPDHCNYSLAEAVWLHAWLARDAEVQALREALEKIVELSSKPLTGGVEFAVAFDSAEKVARVALAGGETGETE